MLPTSSKRKEAYRQRLQVLQSQMYRAQRRERAVLLALLSLFIASAFVIWYAWPIGVAVSPILIGVFVVSAILLRRLRSFHAEAIAKARLCTWYDRGIVRLKEEWQGQGSTGEEFARELHPYQSDLNILGPGSIFELLATTRSAAGAERLAAYLLDPADTSTVRARQAAVIELEPQTALRESLALAGAYAFQECDPCALRDWLSAPIFKSARGLPVLLFLSSACVLVLGMLVLIFAAWQFVVPYLLPLLVAQAVIGLVFQRRVRPVLDGIASLAGEISVLQDGFAIMRRQRFVSGKLSVLVASIGPDAISHMKALKRLTTAGEQRRKDVLYQFSLCLCIGTQLAFAIERWRARHGVSLAVWLDAFAEFEALNAIACYAHEHPNDTFPEIVEDAVLFHAENLGHPLLPVGRCVSNDLRLDRELAFYLVSGSNMAGKSTWLRTVGLAAVLAAAGAPLRATSARVSVFTVCASISIVDSLTAGKSKFLAEVERLRTTIHAARHQAPVLFLIDEILSGTNSADRCQVAESVLDVLISAGTVGLLSTHDSTLVALAQLSRLHGRNVHMSSENPDDPLDFDYRILPGPVKHANALAIARLAGIETPS